MENKLEQEKVQAIVHIQEIKEPEQLDQQKPTLTVKEKIDNLVDNYADKNELKKQIFQLVQRILYPEQFCPECNERMFFDTNNSSYNCPNCGHQSLIAHTTRTTVLPRVSGKVPDVVEKAIALANESMKETPIPTRPTALGDKIRKLVSDRDAGGPATPTAQDEARVKNSDKNVANKINWI